MADPDRIKRNLGKMIDQGAPESDLNAYLSSEGFKSLDAWKAAASGRKPQGRSDAAANAFGQAFGAGDELSATVRAALPEFSNWMMRGPALQRDESIGGSPTPQTVSTAPTQAARYDEELTRQRAQTKADAEAYPVLTTGANITGNVASTIALSALPGVRALMGGGGGLLANTAKGAVVGATLGGAQGFGEGEGGFDARLGHAVLPAAVGGVAGGVLPAVGKAGSYVYEKYAPGLLNKIAGVADSFTKTTVPKSLSAAATDGGSPVAMDSLAATIADRSRGAAGNIEGDAATRRLALEIERSGGTGQVRNRLAELGDGAFIADANKGTERLANLGASLPGEAPDKYARAYAQRNQQTGNRFIGAMGDDAERPTIVDTQKFLEKYRSAKGREIYDPVLRSGTFNISPEMDDLLRVPAIRETMDQIIADAEKHGVKLGPAEAAHMVKQQLNKNTDAAFQSGKAVNKDFVLQAGDAWEQAIWAANPAIKEADTAYAKVASLPDWLERGQNFMRGGQSEAAVNVSPAALAADLPGATPHQMQAFRVGSSNVIRDAATSGPKATRRLADQISENGILQQKLTEIYGPEATDRLMKQSAAELAFARGNQNVNAGSQTAQRLASQADEAALSILQGGATSAASLVQMLLNGYAKARRPSEGVRSRLADLLANPDATANRETLALIDTILKQQASARPVRASVAGAAGGSTSGGP